MDVGYTTTAVAAPRVDCALRGVVLAYMTP
jgi:hypothetical protein